MQTDRWFFNPTEGQLAVVRDAKVCDPDTDEVFNDLTIEDMRESDYWFEYDSRQEAMAVTSGSRHPQTGQAAIKETN